MNETEKLMKDCLDNYDYYITTDGKYVFWGEMMTIQEWNDMEYDDGDIDGEIADDDEYFDDYIPEEGITYEEALEIAKEMRKHRYENATPLSPEV